LSVPVLSWSLIDDRTESARLPGGPRSNGDPRRSVNGTEFIPKDLPRPAGGHTRFPHKARRPSHLPRPPVVRPCDRPTLRRGIPGFPPSSLAAFRTSSLLAPVFLPRRAFPTFAGS
jgi:hypothetical protein